MSRNGNLTSCDRARRQPGATLAPRPRSRARPLAPGIVAGLCALGAIGPIGAPVALARRATLTCPAIALRSVSTSTVIERTRVADSGPTVEVTHVHASKAGTRARKGLVDILALGPVLGSMDSRTVRVDWACTRTGVLLTATVTRSARYAGASLQNVLWRPGIEVLALLRGPEASFRVSWRMRLTNGAQLSRAQTPTYPVQRYPATVTREIHRRGTRRRR